MDNLMLEGIGVGILEALFIIFMVYKIVKETKQ
jgi:hypothetical protein